MGRFEMSSGTWARQSRWSSQDAMLVVLVLGWVWIIAGGLGLLMLHPPKSVKDFLLICCYSGLGPPIWMDALRPLTSVGFVVPLVSGGLVFGASKDLGMRLVAAVQLLVAFSDVLIAFDIWLGGW